MLKKIFNPVAAAVVALLFSGQVNAVVINFDDLVWTPLDPPCLCDQPLTNEYESQGLIIDGGYLMAYDPNDDNVISPDNYLLGSDYLRLDFVGTLPTFISMIVNSFHEEAIYFTVYGQEGLIEQQQTDGYAGPVSTPYRPNQQMTFTHAQGIASIAIHGFYNMRTSAKIDDLTLEYADIPAPSTLFLLLSGLLAMIWMRKYQPQCLRG